ncbi:MAG: GNAT family N-acetyltransferase [Flavobacteriales bacterium]|jgi:RimJ/RimL family protein N-acetyltransferase|nr:GNAT family N-acetyltransferase [Flavobacteriales bacterium]
MSVKNNSIRIQELTEKEIPLIIQYWLRSSPEHLIAMGVDLEKVPTEEKLTKYLTEQISLPIKVKESYALIWLLDGKPIGHSNINEINFGKTAKMHLHIWEKANRQKGIGLELLKLSIANYFQKFNLQELICEPYAYNPAPNKTLEKLGFSLIEEYSTIPGSINFRQKVKRWQLTQQAFQNIK